MTLQSSLALGNESPRAGSDDAKTSNGIDGHDEHPLWNSPCDCAKAVTNENCFVMPKDTARLCSTCEALFKNRPSGEGAKWRLYHEDLRALRKSAERGCGLCLKVSALIGLNHSSESLHLLFGTVQLESGMKGQLFYQLEDEDMFGLQFNVGLLSKPPVLDIVARLTAHQSRDSSDRVTNTLTTTGIPRSTNVAQCIRLIKHWLQRCESSHAHCRGRDRSRFLPRRLVKIRSDGPSLSLCLCDGLQIAQDSEYVTLSHCWGKQRIFTLNESNEKRLYHAIPMKEIPRIFCDAAKVAFECGYRYIWIDSLCIKQDTKEDWLSQSTQMDQIYGSAVLNIAGTGFADGSNGLFVNRTPEQILPLRLDVKQVWPAFGTSTRERGHDVYMLEDRVFQEDVEMAPLNRRGWVLQERLLSARTLHFGARQLFWECHQGSFSELFIDEPPDIVGVVTNLAKLAPSPRSKDIETARPASDLTTLSVAPALNHKDEPIRLGLSPPTFTKKESDLYRQWSQTVTSYSLGNLTNTSDKLPAISGAAKAVGANLHDDYLAGLWRRNLHRELCWFTEARLEEITPDQSEYRAPTWSWASFDGPILTMEYQWGQWDFDNLVHHCLILGASTSPIGRETTGPISGGYLRLKGFLFIAPRIDFATNEFFGERNSLFEIELQVIRAVNLSLYLSQFGLSISDDDQVNAVTLSSHRHRLARLQDHFCLPILSFRWGYQNQYFRTIGLVLAPDRQHKGQFYRIGLYESREQSHIETMGKAREKLPDEYFHEYDGDGGYTITII